MSGFKLKVWSCVWWAVASVAFVLCVFCFVLCVLMHLLTFKDSAEWTINWMIKAWELWMRLKGEGVKP